MENNLEKNINIGGEDFKYIKKRLNGGRVFANSEKTEYLRVATDVEIMDEVNLTRELYERGFPVPEVISTGILEGDDSYYIERAIGDKVFGDIFMDQTKKDGVVKDEVFEVFLKVIIKYSEAQFNSNNFVAKDVSSLDEMISLDNVMRNNPPSQEMSEMFMEAYKKAVGRVTSLPWGYIQADLNAFNILQGGIIDFELASFGPVGYDIITNLYFGRMWPKQQVAYVFSEDQISRYIMEIDRVAQERGLPIMSQYQDDFILLKVIWASAKDKESEEQADSNPDFWEWRVKMRDWCIKRYLKGEKIDSNLFEHFATI